MLAAAGGVVHDDLVQMADKHFGNISTMYEHTVPALAPAQFTGSEVSIGLLLLDL